MKRISFLIILLFLISVIISGCIDTHKKDYETAVELYESGDYKAAAERFAALVESDYKDSQDRKKQSLYFYAGECFEKQNFDEAIKIYESIENYSDSSDKKQEVLNEKSYISAVDLYEKEEYKKSKEIFESIESYKDSTELLNEILYIETVILYDEAVIYMNDNKYEEAVGIFQENAEFKDSKELLELCNKHIKYNQAVVDFNADKIESAYTAFAELGDFSDSADYVMFIDAIKAIEEEKYGEAAEKLLSLSEFIHKNDLDESAYETCLYLYYDQQFQIGNKYLSSLSLLPLDNKILAAYKNQWLIKRRNSIWTHINNDENLNIYYYKTDTSKSPVEVTGTGLYINSGAAKYGAGSLANYVFNDVPVFFLADSPEKVRYVMNFDCSAKYYEKYDDGTTGYETTVTITIKDTADGQILFSKSYITPPPYQTRIKGDVYPGFDFLEKGGADVSVYESEIRPVLAKLFE